MPMLPLHRRQFLGATLAFLTPRLAGGRERKELPFRQVHLDFHTSELIPDVAADFNPQEFARTLQTAHVNSANLFAKCHHGWAYYDTKVAHRHPSLRIDLLGQMIEACSAANIDVNYYYSLVWDVRTAREHPEWLMLDQNGKPTQLSASWPSLCLNTPYFDQVLAENREIVAKYKTAGGWFDILKQPPDGCYCQWCRRERRELGLTDRPADLFRHNKIVAKRVERRLGDTVREKLPGALTFYNSRLVIGVRDELPEYSHIEIESLPTGGWGYSHFQQRVRYMRTLGKDMVGMTGRFHKSWGDFGGLKNQAALDFECLNFLANGTKVCIGDQLHPRGRLDPVTYARIGNTYDRVLALEPYATRAKAVADIGVISTAATNPERTTQKIPTVDQGFTNMLLELHHQFDVLDAESDPFAYKLIIVPDEIRPTRTILPRLKAYLAKGGAVIMSHESMREPDGDLAVEGFGIKLLGPAKFDGEYLLLQKESFLQIDDTPYFLYQKGMSIRAEPGVKVLATYGHPYFDRSPEHFSSHKQTPIGSRTMEPVITRKGNAVYIANPFFRSYALDAYGVQKQVIAQLIEDLLPKPAIRARHLPSTAQVTVLEQPGHRLIVHVLHYPLTRRAPDIDVIEEPGLLKDVELEVRYPQAPSAVRLVPEDRAVDFDYENGYARFKLPWVEGHQAVLIR